MDDQEIVAAIMHGDASGAGAFDQYAYDLYAYCRAQLANEADAATAVQDTFIVVAAKLPMLRDPSRMRAWLFAIARSQCQGRVQGGGSQAADMTHYAEAFAASPHETQLGGLVLTALGELKPGQRELLELNVRHELDGADLGDVLGLPGNRAVALAAEARSSFEASLGALLAASPVAEQSSGWTSLPDDTLTGRRSARDRSAAAMLGLLVPPAVPPSLRQDVSHLLTDPSPGPTGYRERVIRRSKSFRADGFPVLRGSRAGFTLGRERVMAAVAAAAVLILVGGGALFVKMNAHGSSPSAATQPAVTVSASPSAGSAASSPSRGKARSAKSGSTTGSVVSGAVGNQLAGVPSSAAASTKSKTARKSPSPTASSKSPTSKPTTKRSTAPPTTAPPTTAPPTTPPPTSPAPTSPAPTSTSTPTTGGASLISVLLDVL
ncbi:MAG: RNA polymerase sigma factor [Streptosporangiaceae bacterium]